MGQKERAAVLVMRKAERHLEGAYKDAKTGGIARRGARNRN